MAEFDRIPHFKIDPRLRKLAEKRLAKSKMPKRPDGRPEAFDIGPQNPPVRCAVCTSVGILREYQRPNVFVLSRHFSPWRDGKEHLVCHGHLPPHVVISDPFNGFECRNAEGTERWFEGPNDGISPHEPIKPN